MMDFKYNNKSIFTKEFQKTIKETVEKYKYDPAKDPVLIDHKKKIRKILRGWKLF